MRRVKMIYMSKNLNKKISLKLLTVKSTHIILKFLTIKLKMMDSYPLIRMKTHCHLTKKIY